MKEKRVDNKKKKEKEKGKGKEKGKRHQETKEIEGKVKKIVHALYTFVYTQNAPRHTKQSICVPVPGSPWD